jgi:hypothetical protein
MSGHWVESSLARLDRARPPNTPCRLWHIRRVHSLICRGEAVKGSKNPLFRRTLNCCVPIATVSALVKCSILAGQKIKGVEFFVGSSAKRADTPHQ